MDLIKIMQCYDSNQQKFKFGDHDPKAITSEDVVEIFGLNNQEVELPNTDKSTKNMKDKFVKTYFAKQKIVKKRTLLKHIKNQSKTKLPKGQKILLQLYVCICYNHCYLQRPELTLHGAS